MSYPNKRDCEHGRQWGKCPECDLWDANVRIGRLEKALWKIIQVWPEGEDVRYENSIEHIAQTALGLIKATTERSKE